MHAVIFLAHSKLYHGDYKKIRLIICSIFILMIRGYEYIFFKSEKNNCKFC